MAAGSTDPPPRVPDFNQMHPQASKSSIVNKSLGTGSLGDRGQSLVPSAWSPRLALAWGQPRARSANQRRGGRTPLTLSPCFAGPLCSEAPESQLTWPPSPVASWGPSLGHWSVFTLRLFALSQGLSPAQGPRKIVCRIAYLNASPPSSLFPGAEEVHPFICFSVGFTDPQRLRTTLAHQELQVLFWMQGGTL